MPPFGRPRCLGISGYAPHLSLRRKLHWSKSWLAVLKFMTCLSSAQEQGRFALPRKQQRWRQFPNVTECRLRSFESRNTFELVHTTF